MQSNIYDYVKGNVNIVDVIEKFSNITLSYIGNGKYVGHHPSHESQSKTSMHVNEHEGLFYCHNCGVGGSCIDYVLSLNDNYASVYDVAVEIAKEFNIDIFQGITKKQKDKYERRQNRIESIQNCFTDAIEFYHDQLADKRSYFHDRGINDKTIDKLKLGYAPEDWTCLKNHLEFKGHKQKTMLETGMLYEHVESGKILPYFFNRYIFPYWKYNRPCYASGRDASKDGTYITPDGQVGKLAKYIKLKINDDVDTDVVHHQLWGINRLRVPRRLNKKQVNVKFTDRTNRTDDESNFIHETVQADPPPRIVVAEGILDAVLSYQELAENGWVTISPTTNQLSKEDLIDIVDVLEKYPRCELTFCFDMDEAGYRGAWKSVKHCSDALFFRLVFNYINEVLKVNTKPEHIEEKYNVIASVPKEYKIMMEWISQRKSTVKMSIIPKPEDIEKMDLADMFKMGKTDEVLYWLEAAVTAKEYELKLKDNPIRFFYDSKKFVPKKLSDELCMDGRMFYCVEDTIYEYNTGIYEKCKVKLKKDVNLKLKHLRKSTTNGEVLKDIINTYGLEDSDTFIQQDIINFKNGLIPVTSETEEVIRNVPTSKHIEHLLFSHTPHLPMLSQIPINYNHEAKCPKIDKFISEIVPEQDIPIMYEMIGYCMHASTDMESSFILVGEGSNGKSTFLKLVEKLLGKRNVSHISMQDLDGSRFKYAEIFGKLANIYADIPNTPLLKVDRFNSIVTGDIIQAERKGEHPFEFTPYSTLIFSCNEIPKSYTKTKGYYRRIIPIRFPYNFSVLNNKDNDNDNESKDKQREHQTKLIDRIATMEELQGLARVSLVYYARAVRNGAFSISDNSLIEIDEYRKYNEPELEFIKDTTIVIIEPNLENENGQMVKVSRTALYDAYKEWISELKPNLKPIPASQFYKTLKSQYPFIEEYNTRIGGRSVTAFKGIGLLETETEDSSDDIPL